MTNLAFGSEVSVEWHGLEGRELIADFLDPRYSSTVSTFEAHYLVEKKASWADAIGGFGTLDTVTPDELKGIEYYALQAAIFCYSINPVGLIYVPKGYERLADYFLEDKENRRRFFKERDLVGILKNRETLKAAIRFLVDKKVIEQTAIGVYAVRRKPLKKFRFVLP
jgi:hypothetical protein